jgi:hypothetical protein
MPERAQCDETVRRCVSAQALMPVSQEIERVKSNLWRAGLPRVGVRSAPDDDECGVSGTPLRLVLGLLRNPTRGKPARHRLV